MLTAHQKAAAFTQAPCMFWSRQGGRISVFLCFGWVSDTGGGGAVLWGLMIISWEYKKPDSFRLREQPSVGKEAWSTSAPNPGMVLQRYQPGDNWGLPGAVELGGAGISDSGEVSSWRGREERVRTFMQGS